MVPTNEPTTLDRYGRFVLLSIFVVLLGGRFTFGRLGDLPDWDLRWPGLVAIGFLCLVWALVAHERRTPVRPGAMDGWFLAWAAWMGVSVLWAPPGVRAWETLLDLFFLVLFVVGGWNVAGRLHPQVADALWWWLYLAGWVYAAGALVAGPDAQGRFSAFGGGPNVFVRVMALALLATVFLAVIRRTHWVLIGLLPFLYGAYMSGSRGGVLALLVVVAVGGVPLARRMTGQTRAAIVLGSCVLGALAPFFYDPSWTSFLERRFIEQTLEEGYDSQRMEILGRALRLFAEHLWFGVGLDGFYAVHGPSTEVEYPHNLMLASTSEGGLVGGMLLLAALVAAAVTLHRLRPLSAEALGLGLAAVFMLVAAMFSGGYYDSRLLWFFLGLAVIRARSDSAVPESRGRGPASGRPPRRSRASRIAASS